MKNEIDILIVGFGNLGSRVLQGFLETKYEFTIHVYDIKSQKYAFLNKYKEKFFFHKNFLFLKKIKKINLVLICNSLKSSRSSIIKEINSISFIKRLVIEKPLANNLNDLEDLSKIISNSKIKTYVNTFWKQYLLLNNIEKKIIKNSKKIVISGHKWGLLCNFLHIIDFITLIKKTKVNQVNLIYDKKYSSKRNGFTDIFGELVYELNDGTKLHLIDSRIDQFYILETNKLSIELEKRMLNESYMIKFKYLDYLLNKRNSIFLTNFKISLENSKKTLEAIKIAGLNNIKFT